MNRILKNIIVFIIIVIYIIFALHIGCIYKRLLGISCPGCGLTRAYKSLIHGDIKQAFYYHPLFWTIPTIIIAYLLKYKKIECLIGITIILFFIVYIIRFLTNTLV